MDLVLETARLALRHFALDDAPFVLELLNEPEFLRFIGDKGVRDLAGARAYLEEGPIRMYAEHGLGLLLVELRESGEALGTCGLLRREGLAEVDIGFAFLARHRRQGYALEASRGVLDHARRVLGLERVIAIAAPDNTASAALLARLGLFPAGAIRLEPGGEPCVLFTPEGSGGRAPGARAGAPSVRAMRAGEGPALVALFRDTVHRVNARDYDPRQLAAWAPAELDVEAWCARFEGYTVFVAEDADGRRAGFADLGADGHVDRFFVSADHQGQGVGRSLMEALVGAARARGLERLHSEVSLTARGFFERHGFEVVEARTVALRGTELANFRMERDLR